MSSLMAHLRRYPAGYFLFILVLLYGLFPIHQSLAQAPIDDPVQPDQNAESATETKDNFGLNADAESSVVPSELVGVWKGTIHVDPNFGNNTFSALLTLINGNVGEIIGTSAHPSVKCGGEMRLQNATADAVITESDYKFGPCLDGTHILRLASEGTLLYEWHDPNSARVDQGTLTKVDGDGTSIPIGYGGVWKGTANQVNPSAQWTALVALVNGGIGSIVGTFASPTYNCGGELVLLSVNNETIDLKHDITYGNCWDNGVDTLQVLTDVTMDYHWTSPDNSSTASGILSRISGPLTQSCTLPNFGDENGNPLRQDVGTWAGLPYGGTDYFHNGQTIFLPFIYYGNNQDTIAAWGCYLTSAAMIINYYAEQQSSSFRTYPGLLNEWLQHHNGYYTGNPLPSKQNPQFVGTSFVIPAKVAEYANLNGVIMAYIDVDKPKYKEGETVEQFIARTTATVNASMCSLNPIIMGVTGPIGQHYIDSTGTQTESDIETWQIYDPLKSAPATLFSAYSNTYNQIVRFSGNSPNRVLSIAVHSPVEIVILDSEGRRTGYDPRIDTAYNEIPGSNYGIEFLAASGGGGGVLEQTVLDINTAILGEFVLQVTGINSSSYVLEIFATNDLGTGILTRLEGETFEGNIDTFSLTYSSSTGQPIQITEQDKILFLPIIVR